MQVRVAHSLGAAEARSRVEAAARRHGVALAAGADGMSGTLEKSAAFVGKVRASYRIEPDALEVRVLERPMLLPEATVRRMLEEELARLLAPLERS
jgi:hypothetical protein